MHILTTVRGTLHDPVQKKARPEMLIDAILKLHDKIQDTKLGPNRRAEIAELEAELAVSTSAEESARLRAAIAAHDAGAKVLLLDRALIGRGGATVMAQMTVAAAMGEEVPC